MAGSKKHRWHLVSKYMPGYFGRKGFKRYRTQVVCDTTINVGQLSKSIDNFVSEGKATGSKGVYTIDLGVVGYTKLLGTGNVEVKLNVTVQKCSTSAKQKIEAAGGSIETAEKTSDSKKDKTAGD
jgi:large subunit ribosomal protein L15